MSRLHAPKRYGYCGLADMGAGASPNQHKNQLYFNTRRFIECTYSKQLQNTMEINDFEFGMCFGDVTNCCFFVLQYVAHITNVF